MFLLVFVCILLSNYVAVANIDKVQKIGYFTILIIIAILSVISKIL